ncbi:MAG: gliding motility-associated C-terminal domain-containing protein, partial [Saprospiraceae bacterium]
VSSDQSSKVNLRLESSSKDPAILQQSTQEAAATAAPGTTATADSLPAGNFWVTISDVNGCEEFLQVTIGENNTLAGDFMVNVEPTCDVNNGSVTVSATGGSGDYTYTWPAPLATGATQDTLIAGVYDVTITDNIGDCETVVTVLLENAGAGATLTLNGESMVSCAGESDGTLDYTVTYEPGFAAPADTIITITGTTTEVTNGTLAEGSYVITILDANDCLVATATFDVTSPDPLAVNTTIIDVTCDDAGSVVLTVTGGTGPFNYTWLPDDATPGDSTLVDVAEGSYLVTITDANGCSIALSNIEVADNCIDCDDLEVTSSSPDTIPLYGCEGQAPYCIDISLEDILGFEITNNGQPYTGSYWGCGYDTLVTISTFPIPSQGLFGPYEVNSFMVNGINYSGTVMDIFDLVDSMNVWDTNSNWVYNNLTLSISGGNSNNTYSTLTITQTLTGAFSTVDIDFNEVPNMTALSLSVGPHDLIFTDVNGCSDTLFVDVLCITPDNIVDTIFVGTQDTLCFTSDELPGTIQYMENVCEEESGAFVFFETLDDDTYCIEYFGSEVGTETACIVLCDDFGICDTTYVTVTVLPQDSTVIGDEPPVALPDSTTTEQGQEVEIPVMLNDTINGVFDTLYVLTPPTYGDVTIDDDGIMTYQPDEEYCDAGNPDTYTYVLCNTYACDTTIVSILVLCDDITVFTGFSPNEDGVNDFFTIQGIENFPDSELSIFNRWGNEVYFKQGYLNDWDGKWKGKMLPDGTYFYVLEDGKGKSYSGYIQIHR